MRAMSKSELARAAGVSVETFRRWMQDSYIQKRLKPYLHTKQQQILPPKAVQIICEHYAIEID